jgi:hypothetical protein
MGRRSVVAGVAMWAVLLLGSPGAARAECPYFPIPPATGAAGSARELIVGTVVGNVDGQIDDFRLRVDMVLRGSGRPGEVHHFNLLYPGWPPETNPDGTAVLDDQGRPFMPCAPIPAWKGDVIVLALGALAPDGKTRYNAASWLSGDVPNYPQLPRTTLAEIKRLAAVPDTATLAASAEPSPRPGPAGVPLLLLAGLGAGAAIGWRRAAWSARTWGHRSAVRGAAAAGEPQQSA